MSHIRRCKQWWHDQKLWACQQWHAAEDISSVSILLFVLLFTLVLCLLFVRYGDNTSAVMLASGNADVLYPEQYVRDILDGASPWGWFNTQAPYFFPDMVVLSGMVALGLPLTTPSMLYPLISLLAYSVAWFFAARWLGLRGWRLLLATCATTLAYCLCLWSAMDPPKGWANTLIYVHEVGHHASYAWFLPLSAWLTARFANRGRTSDAVVLTVLIALLLLSDMVVAFVFVLPTALYLLWLWRRGLLEFNRLLQLGAIFASAFLFSRFFSFLTPFAGDQLFIEYLKLYWPGSVRVSLHNFGNDLVHYYFSFSRNSGFLGWSFLFCGMYLTHWFKRQAVTTRPTNQVMMGQILVLSATTGLVFVVLSQLGMGVYIGVPHSRQFAALIPVGWCLVALLWLSNCGEPQRMGPMVLSFAGMAVALIIAIVGFQHAALAPSGKYDEQKNMISCFADISEQHGLKSPLSDYWIVRPLWFASEKRVSGLVTDPDFSPLLNASNVDRWAQTNPDSILVWDENSQKAAMHLFGAPRAIYDCPLPAAQEKPYRDWRLYDYSDNKRIHAWNANLASLLFSRTVHRLFIPASSLLTQIPMAETSGTKVVLRAANAALSETENYSLMGAGLYRLRFHFQEKTHPARLSISVKIHGQYFMQEKDLAPGVDGVIETSLLIPGHLSQATKIFNFHFTTAAPATFESLEIIKLR